MRSLLRTVSYLRNGNPRVVNGVDDGSTSCPAYTMWCWLSAGLAFVVRSPFDPESAGLEVGGGDRVAALDSAMRFCGDGLRRQLATRTLAAHAPPTVFVDHAPFLGPLEHASYVAVVREPFRWLASHFYFHRDSAYPLGLGDDCNHTKGRPLTLAEAVRAIASSETGCGPRLERYMSWFFALGALQTRYLCGLHAECLGSEQALTLALEHLHDDYAVVGVLEDWGLSLRVFERLLPAFFCGAAAYAEMRVPVREERGDSAPRPAEDDALPPDSAALLHGWLADDVVLYAAARRRLQAQAAGLGLAG